MTRRQLKTGYFVIEGLNAYAATTYFYYLFFYLTARFHVGNKGNLLVAALNGFIYMFAAYYGGRFAQRRGYHTSLKLGFSIAALALAGASQATSVTGQVVAMAVWTFGICFTWPTLEALASEGESPHGLQRMVGIYNLVWAGAGALAYFTGGAMIEAFGRESIFLVPFAIHVSQLGLTTWLERRSIQSPPPPMVTEAETLEANPRPIARTKLFLRLAWLANPFAYIAISTVVPLIPSVAARLNLTTTLAGVVCSAWFFARWGAFFALWLWPGWHYRFGWFLASFITMVVAFVALLLAPNLAVLIFAQVFFGLAVGLIYYSSLFYSMDAGDTKGEHGGIHESAIGMGIFAGPAAGAAALHFSPSYPNSGAWGVGGLLLAGLAAVIVTRRRG